MLCCLALFTHVNSSQVLIESIVTEYFPRLESVDYVDTFRSLKTRYDHGALWMHGLPHVCTLQCRYDACA